MSHVELTLQNIYAAHFKTLYRGIRCDKNPFDYLLYQMLLYEVKPDLIIEIGTGIAGGSALYLADLLDLIGNGVVHTIDVVDNVVSPLVIEHPRIVRFLGGYQSYDLKNTVGFQNILVIDDGSHKYRDVRGALEKFGGLPKKGSYYIIEDGIIDELGMGGFHGGPMKAIREFLSVTKDYVVDTRWTNFFGQDATFNPEGYLKKIT